MSRSQQQQQSADATPATAVTAATSRTPMLMRACDCGRSPSGPSGECGECAAEARFGASAGVRLGAAHDAFEQEADRIADRIIGQGTAHEPGVAPVASGINVLQRQANEEEAEEELVQTKPASPRAVSTSSAALPAAASAVAAGGHPLGRTERAYFEPRLGSDLSHVRLHTDTDAGQAAKGISARAYTLGHHIAFAPGQYTPSTTEGRRLLAHELVHTLQQASSTTLQRACTPAATCSGGPVQGSAEQFNDDQENEERRKRQRRQRMTPTRARSSGHAGRAAQLEQFFQARNVALMSQIHGIFIDADMASETGAITFSCQEFLGDSLPPGDPDPDGFSAATQDCVFVPGVMNREALRFNRGASRIGQLSRAQWERETLAALTHEATHAFFEQDIEPVLPRPAGVSTPTCTDANVEGELSEIVAMLVEFPFFFDAAQAEASPTGPAHRRLHEYFDTLMDMSGESLPGALIQMGCRCDCNEVDAYVIGRVGVMTGSFLPAQKNALRIELQRRMPSGGRPAWPDTPRP